MVFHARTNKSKGNPACSNGTLDGDVYFDRMTMLVVLCFFSKKRCLNFVLESKEVFFLCLNSIRQDTIHQDFVQAEDTATRTSFFIKKAVRLCQSPGGEADVLRRDKVPRFAEQCGLEKRTSSAGTLTKSNRQDFVQSTT
jgi:hypothetical protein